MDPSSCDEPALLAVADAISTMIKHVPQISETERVALDQALDRILAVPLAASINVPPHANSAMDGYALRAADAIPGEALRIIGKSLAGHPFQGVLDSHTCVRITTGSVIPEGADCVVMQENTLVEDGAVFLTRSPEMGENIRHCGEDMALGDEILTKGTRLGPIEIGLLASQGVSNVEVYRRLKVAVLSTGDELIPPGQALPAGHIYDSNRYGLIAMLKRLAVEVIDLGLIPDQPDAIRQVLRRGAQTADAIISSGGVSVGDADFMKELLSEEGQVNFWKVAIKPGKPFAFGQIGDSQFFGLPGNPVSSMVTLHQLVIPVLQKMAGENPTPSLTLTATAASPFKKRPGRADYQRAHLSQQNNQNQVRSSGVQGSGVLTSFTGANCYVVLERDRGSVSAGETVTVMPFDRFIQ